MGKLAAKIGMAIALAATAALPAAAGNKGRAEALAVLKKAVAISNIEAKGSPAFRLQAEVHIFNGIGQTGGMVMEFWAPGKKLRKEAMVTGYHSLTVQNGKLSWTKSSTKYAPYPIQVIWQALNFAGNLKSMVRFVTQSPRTKLKLRLRELKGPTAGKTKHGKKTFARCVETASGDVASHDCVDFATGHVVEEWNSFDGLHFFFGNYQPFGNKTFPRTMRVFYPNGKEMLEVDVMEIDRLPKPNPKLFAAVPGAREEGGGGCPNMPQSKRSKPASRVKEVQPAYPKKAKEQYISGTVVMYAAIGADGAIHAPWVLNSPSPLLTASALAAVRQWRYRPASVCGKPVSGNTIIRVVFNLGGP